MRIFTTTALIAALFVCLCASSQAQTVTEDALTFEISKLPLEHQGPQVIDLKARLDYKLDLGPKDYPDFEEVYKKLVEWMATHPNETDYWEPFNRTLCKKVLAAYPTVASVTLEIKVHPTFGIQYSHSSIVTVKR